MVWHGREERRTLHVRENDVWVKWKFLRLFELFVSRFWREVGEKGVCGLGEVGERKLVSAVFCTVFCAVWAVCCTVLTKPTKVWKSCLSSFEKVGERKVVSAAFCRVFWFCELCFKQAWASVKREKSFSSVS